MAATGVGAAGGVGGTIILAAYGYWLREKGWTQPKFMRVVRIDNTMAYAITGIFVIATLIVGAALRHSANIAVERARRVCSRSAASWPTGTAHGAARSSWWVSGLPRCRRWSEFGTGSA